MDELMELLDEIEDMSGERENASLSGRLTLTLKIKDARAEVARRFRALELRIAELESNLRELEY